MKRLVSALTLAGAVLVPVSTVKSQEVSPGAIRVESDQVLVPVFVWNKPKFDKLVGTQQSVLFRDLVLNNLRPWQDTVLSGLVAKNFRIFEDGSEQRVQSVTVEAPSVWRVHDNGGEHYEYVGIGNGRWIYPDVPVDGKIHTVISLPYYLLTYTPPPAPVGSCHQVRIKIRGRSDALIAAKGSLNTYCRTTLSATDPLQGTKFGQDLETDLVSGTNGKIHVGVGALILYPRANEARVNIAVHVEPASLSFKLAGTDLERIGLLVRVDEKNGAEATRLSDFDCCQDGMRWYGFEVRGPGVDADLLDAPCAYQTQISLPPGDYTIRVVLSDDHNFGRAELPITVPVLNPQSIALSDIALAKQSRSADAPMQDSPIVSVGAHIPLISKGVEYFPTADTTFKKTNPFFFYLQLYDPLISADPRCMQSTPPPTAPEPINSSSARTGTTSSGLAPSADTRECQPQAQINLRIVNSNSGAVVRGLPSLNAGDFAVHGNQIISIGGSVHIDDLAPGTYQLQAQATTLPSPASLNASPLPPQTTPWRSVSFRIQ